MENKKELKKNYLLTPKPMGVYCLRNLVNGKILIGSNKNLDARKNRFDMEFRMGFYNNVTKSLQEESKEFGRDNFSYEVLEYLKPKEDPNYDYSKDLSDLEKKWIEKLQPFDEKGYNKRS